MEVADDVIVDDVHDVSPMVAVPDVAAPVVTVPVVAVSSLYES